MAAQADVPSLDDLDLIAFMADGVHWIPSLIIRGCRVHKSRERPNSIKRGIRS